MNDYLLPMPRLNAKQLKALAHSVRTHAPGNDQVADSVAAALESVSRRRAERLQVFDAGLALSAGLVRFVMRIGDALRERQAEKIAASYGAGEPAARTATPTSRTSGRKSIKLDHPVVQAALRAADQGAGVAPELCDALVARGWLEWVDFEHETAIDMNDPRSLLRTTPAGQALLAQQVALAS